jgi:tetratricopeptide (TPR) repeat protein
MFVELLNRAHQGPAGGRLGRFALVAFAAMLGFAPYTEAALTAETLRSAKADFVGSRVCATCHPERLQTWLKTAHAHSLQEASLASVQGRFDGQLIETAYFRAVPYRREESFWIKVEARDGRPSGDHRISRVVGNTFGQSYLFTGPRGEWRILPLSWNLERSQWDLSERVMSEINGDPHSFPDNYDTREKIFNDGCGQCHATRFDIGYDARTDSYDSRFVEGAVSCESCHGPGSIHVEWHRAKLGDSASYAASARLLHPAKDLDARGILDSCGRCHYKHDWRYAIDDDPRVPFRDIAISRNHDGLGFFADGRLSGLNYHGSTQSQSACFQGGMSCLSCHEMHGGRPRALKWEETADVQCGQCHARLVSDAKAHSHHKELGCVECHMPKLIPGVLHFMRDHSVGSPEPELTERYGKENVPNACGACHQNKSATWAREWKDKWWGPAPKKEVQNVGTVVDLRRDMKVDSVKLATMAEDQSSRLFFRSTAIRRLARQHDAESRSCLLRLLSDRNEEVRQLASAGIAEDPFPEAAKALLALLSDSCRTVRVEAAFALARCGWRGKIPTFEAAYADALKMLERQRGFDEILERLVVLADASERSAEMMRYLSSFSGRNTAIQSAGELLRRYARLLIEQHDSERALEFCNQALSFYTQRSAVMRPAERDLLELDFADALAGLGRRGEAEIHWERLSMAASQGSIPWLISGVRRVQFASTTSLGPNRLALEAASLRLQSEPSAGELLRRARWTLKLLERVP